ncbi:uncharacterized protein LOC121398331 [Xenopus laevis]|uniref:Uncharacterized protein LOC121397955 n=1 Tax=Xenopus laevis TaxID=8355 RepID=A0A8J1LV50_XENLA|nr:uncharacterized protein LOC121397955 [Xenopus laevis]XP_041433412.1 uncharacterized protein LOC121398331 [Xenopus laevis]
MDLVYQQAKIRNGPSFDLTWPHATPSVPNTRKVAVTIHKTNASSLDSFHRSAEPSHEKTKNKDSGKKCPLCGKAHPLLKCSAFREKSIEACKAFLKENICYKCCSSTSHLAKDCKVCVKCTECDRTQHSTPWVTCVGFASHQERQQAWRGGKGHCYSYIKGLPPRAKGKENAALHRPLLQILILQVPGTLTSLLTDIHIPASPSTE